MEGVGPVSDLRGGLVRDRVAGMPNPAHIGPHFVSTTPSSPRLPFSAPAQEANLSPRPESSQVGWTACLDPVDLHGRHPRGVDSGMHAEAARPVVECRYAIVHSAGVRLPISKCRPMWPVDSLQWEHLGILAVHTRGGGGSTSSRQPQCEITTSESSLRADSASSTFHPAPSQVDPINHSQPCRTSPLNHRPVPSGVASPS